METKQVSICIRRPRLKLHPCYRVLEMYEMYENPEKNLRSLSIFEPNFFTEGNAAAAADSQGDKNIFSQIWRD